MRTISVLVAVLFGASAAAAQNVLVSVTGTTPSEFLGSATVPASDIDSDGRADLIVGSSGNPQSAVRAVSSRTGATLYSFPSPTTGTPQFGKFMFSIGDADADGKLDFAVATYLEGGVGYVRAYSGANGAWLHTVVGTATSGLFGFDVCTFGDLDGDGHDDYLASAPASPNPTVVAISGASGNVLKTYLPKLPGAYFGSALAGLGDVDADGAPDFAARRRLDTFGQPLDFSVVVHSGATGAELYSIPNPTGPNTYFGHALDGGRDIDGDGIGDLAATMFDPFVDGKVHLYSGADGAPIRTLGVHGCAPAVGKFNDYGFEVEFTDDVDLDGVADVASSAGRFGALFVHSSVTGRELYRFYHPFGGTFQPTRFTSLPDLDGDGRAEIVTGDWLYSTQARAWVGRVTIYTDGVAKPIGTRYGFGDGTGPIPCPCGNTGPPDSGCLNSSGDGARLFAYGSTSVTADDLYFELEGGVSFNAWNDLVYSNGPNYAMSQIADGLLSIRRDAFSMRAVFMKTGCADGFGIVGPGLRADGGWNAGETWYFQVRCFDPFGPCGKDFNFSNAVALTFTP